MHAARWLGWTVFDLAIAGYLGQRWAGRLAVVIVGVAALAPTVYMSLSLDYGHFLFDPLLRQLTAYINHAAGKPPVTTSPVGRATGR